MIIYKSDTLLKNKYRGQSQKKGANIKVKPFKIFHASDVQKILAFFKPNII